MRSWLTIALATALATVSLGLYSTCFAGGRNVSTVSIQDFKFVAANNTPADTILLHDTVQWSNDGSVNHTSSSDAGSGETWDSGILGPGGDFSHTFDRVGSFKYHCSVYGSMHGTIVVLSASQVSASSWGKLKALYRSKAKRITLAAKKNHPGLNL